MQRLKTFNGLKVTALQWKMPHSPLIASTQEWCMAQQLSALRSAHKKFRRKKNCAGDPLQLGSRFLMVSVFWPYQRPYLRSMSAGCVRNRCYTVLNGCAAISMGVGINYCSRNGGNLSILLFIYLRLSVYLSTYLPIYLSIYL